MTTQETTTITIQDKHNDIIEHVYVFEAKGKYLFIWYRQHTSGAWRRVRDQHSMGDLQFSNWPAATHQVNGYKEYYNQAKAQYNKGAKQ